MNLIPEVTLSNNASIFRTFVHGQSIFLQDAKNSLPFLKPEILPFADNEKAKMSQFIVTGHNLLLQLTSHLATKHLDTGHDHSLV